MHVSDNRIASILMQQDMAARMKNPILSHFMALKCTVCTGVGIVAYH